MVFDLVGHLLVFFLEELVKTLFYDVFENRLVLVFSARRPIPVLIGEDVEPRVCVKICFGKILRIESLGKSACKVTDASGAFVRSPSLEIEIKR